ncbi:YggS family pyridoxal phosphate-dependent enzyme [Heliophilum fasciatum]|uniref:Pyridoxal phosphate homeostasis protein n=1 Tax=Heliophilum fasciatum TaxID=35700 RepID=A0A4R2RIY5_9FIRM|nr:YggS family pyridoxal phosphate-dependent enzyme [Heliophilum fasciatum]MCW2278881.1 pyridoxal phosphate enzyme (YggS family) [Heliophilum fasciatum]TCP62107.1 hypothetical protein EDD73_12314 [Heliophilum fasciatum]
MSPILVRLNQVRQRMQVAALRAGRNPQDVQLLAVTKTVPVEAITPVVAAGVDMLGESRVQELTAKIPQFPNHIQWHMIGTLQSRKVKSIANKTALIHSLDRLALAEEINKWGQHWGKAVACLVEVNVAEEPTKHGIVPHEALGFIETLAQMPGIAVCGLMTMAPYCDDPEEVRHVFRDLRRLADRVTNKGFPNVSMQHLSMGMSNDFEVAIEEGATIVRIGSEIFGERN